ncbi:MAG: pentapeptide repeat-containing protein [Leptolyngbyaceae cyanobacterium HOT.MB2.61]|nr:pentapeptide repeat-containing protein [Leptolyngbyaceae cyanobacterium HOT.MB2.61]
MPKCKTTSNRVKPSYMKADELLEYYRWGERDFRGVNLRGISLRDVRLRDVDLNCADLRGASLMIVDLSGANLHQADLSGAFLIHSNLSFANLTQANLTKAFLILANLHHSCLTEANLSQANLTKANLSEVNGFAEAILNQTVSTGALLLPGSPQAGFRPLHHLQNWKFQRWKLWRLRDYLGNQELVLAAVA